MQWIKSIMFVAIIVASVGFSTAIKAQAPPKGSPAKPPSQQGSGRYIVQVGAVFPTSTKAKELVMKLQAAYPSAHIEARGDPDPIYRVVIGPYNTREDARKAANDLTGQGFAGVMILPSSSTPNNAGSDRVEIEPASAPSTDEAMQRVLAALSTQIGALTDELKQMRRETEHTSAMLELLINEERLAKVEEKIQDAITYKTQIDAREVEIVRRMRNIQSEIALRGGLRRDETEAAIRADLQKALDDVHAQQAAYPQRVAELNDQATRLRTRVDSLRKKLE
jgi:ATP-dependent Lon protease